MDINEICRQTTNPEALNALHACRDGHPLGRGIAKSMLFRNAWATSFGHVNSIARQWLLKQAEKAEKNER